MLKCTIIYLYIFLSLRAFPALYRGSHKRMKKMTPEPAKVTSVRILELSFCLLTKNSEKTPKDETILLQAGLGRRTVNISDDADHTEVRHFVKLDV